MPDQDLVLTSLHISGGTATIPGGEVVVVCFTERRRVMYPHPTALLTSSPYLAGRLFKNLEDIVYNGHMDSCTLLTGGNLNKRHFLIQFATPTPVTGLVVRTQPGGVFSDKFVNMEIRVGNSSSTGDFSEYQLLATFQGPPGAPDIDIVVQTEATPVVGRFVSLQTMTGNNIQICMLEVF